MNGGIGCAVKKNDERPQASPRSVVCARSIKSKEPATEAIRRDECEGRYCAAGNPRVAMAFAFRAMGEDGRKMFRNRSTPSVEEMIKTSVNSEADFRYAMAFAAEIGFDKIVAYARTPIQENAREAIEAMENCAKEYHGASTAGKYYVKEHFLLAAMMVARQQFKEREMGHYADRATVAIDEVRSKEMDPYYAQDMKAIMRGAPRDIF